MRYYKTVSSASFILFCLFIIGCNPGTKNGATVKVDNNGFAILTDDQVKDIVMRSYQYVAMYNVNNKFAARLGWNAVAADTRLKDHTMTDIPRPNNDTYYISAMLDLRAEPIILELPVFGSKYSSLMVTAYDHYVNLPKTTRNGDFQKPEKILFYSDRTPGYKGENVDGVDMIFKANGDFISAIFRIMPHASDPAKHESIVKQMALVKIQTLSEFKGEKSKPLPEIQFPAFGKTDADIFENNLLEVMQFVFNHVSFDTADSLDRKVLEAYKPLGIEPGREYNAEKMVRIDGPRFKRMSQEIQQHYLSSLESESGSFADLKPLQFLPKGSGASLEALLSVSIIGPIGLPMKEVIYTPVVADGSEPMNAKNDYVVKMTRDELPPALAFWSCTLYDQANGFFIPNDRKKYSVGENAGYKLNKDGGIEIYISEKLPKGVPEENWLPINRKDEKLDMILRIYVPDLDKVKAWKAPKAVKLK